MHGKSDISGFYKLSVEERRKKLIELLDLEAEDFNRALSLDDANRMIENVVSLFQFPMGIATNFLINDTDYLVPMVIEEPSVVAAASNSARIARKKGGFHTDSDEPIMIGQIQLIDIKDPFAARMRIIERKGEIIEKANACDPVLLSLGGGAKDVDVSVIDSLSSPMVIVHLLVDVKDAMGANAVNTMCEAVAPFVSEIAEGRYLLRIISNLAVYRLARAWAVFDKDLLGGEEVVDGIINAYNFAEADPFRCATHNKGIMNGVDALVIATGNDFRAVEAGAHSYAALGGYHSLTNYEKNGEGDLVGSIELPVACGTVGGATSSNPLAKLSLKLLGVKSAQELAGIMAALGLAQNLAALRALASEGIQRGHMELHARNIAIMAGASGDEIDAVAERMANERKVRVDRAKEILEEIRKR